MNATTTKQIGFRLPAEHERALVAAAEKRGVSPGLYAREVLVAHLANFSEFDELRFRLGAIERVVTGVGRDLDELRDECSGRRQTDEIGQLRASLAALAFRLLTEFGGRDEEDATEWVVGAFGVSEE
ncbi:MAG: hypothetical protein KDB27_16410 [Planctomycetales bacterium]|nr:hypothetical protein [Planctomycetales bacterium]